MVGWWEWANVERHEDGGARLHLEECGARSVRDDGDAMLEGFGKVREGKVSSKVRIVGRFHMYRKEAHGAGSLDCWQWR
jgi:hypothetical protein